MSRRKMGGKSKKTSKRKSTYIRHGHKIFSENSELPLWLHNRVAHHLSFFLAYQNNLVTSIPPPLDGLNRRPCNLSLLCTYTRLLSLIMSHNHNHNHHDHSCNDESHSHDHDHSHSSEATGPQDNLFIHIDRSNVVALNTTGEGKEVIKPWHERLDESVVCIKYSLHIPFVDMLTSLY